MRDFPHLETLKAVLCRLVPADEHGPDAVANGVLDYLDKNWDDALASRQAMIIAGLAGMEAAGFAELEPGQQDVILSDLEQDEGGGDVNARWLRTLCELTAEGYYGDPGNGGNVEMRSWDMISFDPDPKADFDPSQRDKLTPHGPDDLTDEYDVIIVGAGAGGGIVAGVLAEDGHRVLLLERGRWLTYEQIGHDHLRNHRLNLYGHNTGPAIGDNPRVIVDHWGSERVVQPHEWGYHNNAMTVGGGTRVYGAQAWRFLPEDFLMASMYGVPEGSSLADWPLGYDMLEPYYTLAEQEIGVSGANGDEGHHRCGRRSEDYPMPPLPANRSRDLMSDAAAKLGWSAAPVPLLINSTPYMGRQACVRCGQCIGFACPSDAKNGSHNTMIPRALATGNCTLVTGAQVDRIVTDEHGHATGVHVWLESDTETPVAREIRARAVVCSAGAIESARLLLASACAKHPKGLGNHSDHLGRHLQGHRYVGATGYMAEPIDSCDGPGVSIATCEFNHGNPGIIGGGMLANEFTKTPIIFWRNALPPGLPLWGMANKDFMRRHYRSSLEIKGPVQDIPNPACRVTLDGTVRDRLGMPVARLSGVIHPETRRTGEFMRERAIEWMKAADVAAHWSQPVGIGLSAGQHQAGTCRMSLSPSDGVCDPTGRVHGHRNLFVADGSLHVTNGGFNPVLTIMALAFKVADHVADSL